jgi:hypothetical protein
VIDGWLAMHLLMASPDTQGIPVIVLTADTMVEGKATGARCQNFDSKRADIQRLIGKISALADGRADPHALWTRGRLVSVSENRVIRAGCTCADGREGWWRRGESNP